MVWTDEVLKYSGCQPIVRVFWHAPADAFDMVICDQCQCHSVKRQMFYGPLILFCLASSFFEMGSLLVTFFVVDKLLIQLCNLEWADITDVEFPTSYLAVHVHNNRGTGRHVRLVTEIAHVAGFSLCVVKSHLANFANARKTRRCYPLCT